MESRVDASLLTEHEREMLQPLLNLADQVEPPCLKGSGGAEIPIPEPIFKVLLKVVQQMRLGRSIFLVPEEETFTTQAAADYLGMSRQHFVKLLEEKKIPFHRVGSHRRAYFGDLRAYALERDKDRRETLDRLFDKLRAEEHYESDTMGDPPANAH